MKKPSTDRPQKSTDVDESEAQKPCKTATGVVIPMPRRPASAQQIFRVAPGVDTLTLLKEACETLAALNALIANFATKLEGPSRNEALALQQLAAVAEMLVNQVRDNLYPQDAAPADPGPTRH